MSHKTKLYTRKLLHRARLRKEADAKANRIEADTQYRRDHDAEMRKMLKGVDLDHIDRS
jgi:hypothetical protein